MRKIHNCFKEKHAKDKVRGMRQGMQKPGACLPSNTCGVRVSGETRHTRYGKTIHNQIIRIVRRFTTKSLAWGSYLYFLPCLPYLLKNPMVWAFGARYRARYEGVFCIPCLPCLQVGNHKTEVG